MKNIFSIIAIILLLVIPPIYVTKDINIASNELPPTFSWRNINGIDYTTPVKDQRPAPTCEAYALVAALETLVQYEQGYPFNCDLSEAHLYFYSGGTYNAGGVNLQKAAQYLVDHGVPDEGCFPDPHRPYDFPFESLPDWENRTVKIQEWGWIENEEQAIKHALIEHGPLIICMLTRLDFFYYRGGIYIPRGKIRGGHVITIVGYDDIQRCWIIKNSGGEQWGEEGYIRVSYDAHNDIHPFFWPFYGGTGILYIDGVYGNFIPDVPKISIERPTLFHTYVFNREFPTFFKKLPIQQAAPRIIGNTKIKTQSQNTNRVEFYVDGHLYFIDEEPPFEWELDCYFGLHTIETYAYNGHSVSKDVIDVFVL
jgi:hypothetical protein